MSSKKEEKAQVAADRIKAAALTAAKGLSRAQAERAATAAARNVNAYGQKEEGPSRWQEKREAKRQMYLMSTEKAVKLGERKELKPTMSTIGGNAQCQKCYSNKHWTYECKGERVYISRPSRTQQLKNPKLRVKVSEVTMESDLGYNNRNDPKEENVKVSSKKTKRKHRSAPSSDSEDSVFETDSGSGSSSVTGSDYSSESSSGSSSSSDSEEERRRRKRKSLKKKQAEKKSKGKSRRYSTSSESSDSDSGSDSDSDDKRSKRKKRHSRRR
ncbi:uncharacterized protein LOC131631033 [Vicia villosa]|uniref:uncharacterized protein LOC131631033 n=1 Tax=Vicia villosa TaxID=3911 RepID=UPI00273C663A|nr:uncharacterized protein LOC131631033 [Vicia villosa]